MSPSSRVDLVHFHLEEVRVLLPDHPFNRASPNGGFRPPRLYSAAVDVTGSASLCPEKVFVTRIPLLTGPTPEDAAAVVIQFRLNLALNSSSSHHQFCFIRNRPAADDGGQNYVDPAPNRGSNYIPDLNVSPPNETAPTIDFVGEIKSQNISRFTDHVVCCLGWSDEEVAEYKKILSSISEAEIGNLDSIRIWNSLTLGAKIQETLVKKGLLEAPMSFDDLQFPPPEELLPIPEKGRKAAKKARYCGVVGIDEPKSPIPEAGDSDSSD
ncbi:hypothetical protein Pyn_02658 [Prunus yedoensis var. nudiflora]|uniref:Uncharacterized protein n=1 Tax=Prunus yedoensis var. nudiflora TaxID=2094558 RepID=A0A314ZLD2_PRUYE|nr:hypothetical protein Pyn_02658 [Prunus yedoensis var. nudiflora]